MFELAAFWTLKSIHDLRERYLNFLLWIFSGPLRWNLISLYHDFRATFHGFQICGLLIRKIDHLIWVFRRNHSLRRNQTFQNPNFFLIFLRLFQILSRGHICTLGHLFWILIKTRRIEDIEHFRIFNWIT